MKKFIIIFAFFFNILVGMSQPVAPTTIRRIETTTVKYQARTNTCWCYSTTSLIESECLRNTGVSFDLSEMFTARNLFIEKGKRYIQSEGKTLFEAGGLAHDALYGMMKFGAIPEEYYPSGQAIRNSETSSIQLEDILKTYLQKCIAQKQTNTWMEHYVFILDSALGVPPQNFNYQGKEYTPVTFAHEVLNIKPEDYVTITSFTHHPYYKNFSLEIPDNYLLDGAYFNVPVNELISITEFAIEKGYSVVTDMDVSNNGWNCGKMGFAVYVPERPASIPNGDVPEDSANQAIRQKLFENKTTTDDHLIHLIGTAKSESGKRFFIQKDSGGARGPFAGYEYISENYFTINTLSILLPKAALSEEMLKRINQAKN